MKVSRSGRILAKSVGFRCIQHDASSGDDDERGLTMSNAIIDFRQLHAGIMKELDRAPEREQEAQRPAQIGQTPEWSGPTEKINAYLTRIEQAAAVLQQQRSYVRELEEAVCTLQNHEAELEAALAESERRSSELEEAVLTKRERARRAEAAAVQAGKLVQELQRAVGDANARADALTSAIDKAFDDFAGPSHVEAAA
jgi:chromosome segregation ATPase